MLRGLGIGFLPVLLALEGQCKAGAFHQVRVTHILTAPVNTHAPIFNNASATGSASSDASAIRASSSAFLLAVQRCYQVRMFRATP